MRSQVCGQLHWTGRLYRCEGKAKQMSRNLAPGSEKTGDREKRESVKGKARAFARSDRQLWTVSTERKKKKEKRKKKKGKREKLHFCQCRLRNRRIHPEPVFAVCQLTLLLCCLEI